MSETPDYMVTYREFWQSIVERDGALDVDAVARELHDYHEMIGEVSKVYDHVTGGRISKPNTAAVHVISEADALAQQDIDEAVREALAEPPAAPPEGEAPRCQSQIDGAYPHCTCDGNCTGDRPAGWSRRPWRNR